MSSLVFLPAALCRLANNNNKNNDDGYYGLKKCLSVFTVYDDAT